MQADELLSWPNARETGYSIPPQLAPFEKRAVQWRGNAGGVTTALSQAPVSAAFDTPAVHGRKEKRRP